MSTVVAMNEETRMMEQYNDIVANIKPLMTVGKGKNQRVVTGSAVVPLSRCFVDSRYQGMRTHKHLNRLKNKWDERKLTPIILVPALFSAKSRSKYSKRDHRMACTLYMEDLVCDGIGIEKRYILKMKKW